VRKATTTRIRKEFTRDMATPSGNEANHLRARDESRLLSTSAVSLSKQVPAGDVATKTQWRAGWRGDLPCD